MKAKQKVRRVSAQPYVIGVDIGGTFTDIVASGGRSTPVAVAKVLTDYEDLARGVANGISEILKAHAIPAGSVTRVVHGTTLVTNSLIERRGCRTALIVTEGFADVLELGVTMAVISGMAKLSFVLDLVEKEDYCPFIPAKQAAE